MYTNAFGKSEIKSATTVTAVFTHEPPAPVGMKYCHIHSHRQGLGKVLPLSAGTYNEMSEQEKKGLHLYPIKQKS